MKRQLKARNLLNRKSQAGMTLLETLIALVVLMVVAVSLLPMAIVAVTTTENQGHLAARTAEYAQDKMEQLLTLAYNDVTTDTTVFPAGTCSSGCGLTIGGSANPSNPVAGYVDYLDVNGNVVTGSGGAAPANWFYIRAWQVSYLSTSPVDANGVHTIKQITVVSRVSSQVGAGGSLPQSTVVALKTEPF